MLCIILFVQSTEEKLVVSSDYEVNRLRLMDFEDYLRQYIMVDSPIEGLKMHLLR